MTPTPLPPGRQPNSRTVPLAICSQCNGHGVVRQDIGCYADRVVCGQCGGSGQVDPRRQKQEGPSLV